PGFVTDAMGILLLVPPVRTALQRWVITVLTVGEQGNEDTTSVTVIDGVWREMSRHDRSSERTICTSAVAVPRPSLPGAEQEVEQGAEENGGKGNGLPYPHPDPAAPFERPIRTSGQANVICYKERSPPLSRHEYLC
ncbi:MAG: hypothetical protein FD153_2013, partial [Rhodospirillaceae bacterium]